MSMIVDDAITLNGVKYVRPSYVELPEDDRKIVDKLLNEIYGALWTEANYDPYNEDTKKFAKPLADKMAQVNKIFDIGRNWK